MKTTSFVGLVAGCSIALTAGAARAEQFWSPLGADMSGISSRYAPQAGTPVRVLAGELLAPEFSTMGRYEGGRVDDLRLVVSLETHIGAGGTPGMVQLEMRHPRIQKDDAALALDPGALTMSVDIPLAYYSEIFESPGFFIKTWESGGKTVQIYSGYNDKSKYVEITQERKGPSGGVWTEVMKLTVVKSEIIMGKVEKYAPGSDEAYFDEYIVMAERTESGLALKAPELLGRITDPGRIRYVAESPTAERMAAALNGSMP